MTALTLTLDPILDLSDEQFYQLCQVNRDIRFERTANGALIIMPPTGWGTGKRNFGLIYQLGAWVEKTGLGIGFDSSTGFTLPNGADRSPDAAWVKQERIETLDSNPNQFLPLAPDFVVELRSANDNLTTLQNKMREYQDNGVRLGWLINPQDQQVEIYRLGQGVEVLQSPPHLSGEDVLPGFTLELSSILS
ncbi:MAG: Uma2 family endonuclease [Thermosynechococcaceae cyanobacterium]